MLVPPRAGVAAEAMASRGVRNEPDGIGSSSGDGDVPTAWAEEGGPCLSRPRPYERTDPTGAVHRAPVR